MTTVVSTGKTQPAVDLNKIHWECFTFKQPLPGTIKSLEGAFTHYGYAEGSEDRTYDKVSIPISVPNADQVIIGNHIAGGGTVESFMTDYVTETTTLNTEYLAGNISDAKLMAYLELIMARTAEISGKLTIASVEQ